MKLGKKKRSIKITKAQSALRRKLKVVDSKAFSYKNEKVFNVYVDLFSPVIPIDILKQSRRDIIDYLDDIGEFKGYKWSKKNNVDRINKKLYKNYKKFLKSFEWHYIRNKVLKRDNYVCVYCGSKAIQVHHKKYGVWGSEKIKDLISLCGKCHKKIHNIT